MKKMKAIIKIQEFHSRRKQFLKKQQVDTYILIENKLLGFHKQYLGTSKYFSRQIQKQNRSIWILQPHINSFIFLKMLGCIYGLQYCFERSWEIIEIYQMAVYLEIQSIVAIIESDITVNFEDYQYFVLFSFAEKFHKNWLQKLCYQQLIIFGFEQINYNKSDLLLCQKFVVQALVSIHRQEIIKNKKSKIISKQKFKNAIMNYCKTNNVKIDVSYLFVQTVQDIIKQSEAQYLIQEQKQGTKSTKVDLFNSNNNTACTLKQSQRSSFIDRNIKSQDKKKLTQSNFLDEYYIVKKAKSQQQNNNTIQFTQQYSIKINNKPQQLQKFSQFQQYSSFAQQKFVKKQQNYKEDQNSIQRKSVVFRSQLNKIDKSKTDNRKNIRSISPPSSPQTPQFGEYISRQNLRRIYENQKDWKMKPKKSFDGKV